MSRSMVVRISFDVVDDPEAFSRTSADDLQRALCRAFPLCPMSAILVEEVVLPSRALSPISRLCKDCGVAHGGCFGCDSNGAELAERGHREGCFYERNSVTGWRGARS